MAYGRSIDSHNSWFQEQQSLLNTVTKEEADSLCDGFDQRFQEAAAAVNTAYGVDIRKDAKRMMDNTEVMMEYKHQFLEPILEEFKNYPAATEAERVHLESVADQLDKAWDNSAKAFLVQESYNVSNYLPLSTLDFPALVKQYIKFLGKEIIPVQTASSTNIEQRIFVKYLVDNQTGEEYETPMIYFKKDTDGKPLWRKLWNAGKGYRINDKTPIMLDDIKNAPNRKYSVFKHLLDDNGDPFELTPNIRTRLSYDFNIQFVQVGGGETVITYEQVTLTGDTAPADWPTGYYTDAQGQTAAPSTYAAGTYYKKTETVSGGKKVRLPNNGIAIDIQTGGTFLNGGISKNINLAVVDPETNRPTGEVVNIDDRLSGVVDFVKGYVTATSCGDITGIYVNGRISNETNMRTIGFREYPEIRKFKIADGCRFQLPFTVEDFNEANTSLNFNLYNRLVQELVGAQEMFEDQDILDYLDDEFEMYNNSDTDVFALESYMATEYADLDPCAITKNFAGNPWEYRTDAIHNAIASLIYELCDRGKLENMGFVIYGNPKCIRLLKKYVTWTVQKSTEIGGVQMNHAFGVMTDFDLPIRVVASNRIDAYTTIPAYQEGATEGQVSREYFFKIVAYPMDKFHISYKHLRFARHLTNSPENAAYADAQNPGGAAVLVTTSSQYTNIKIQGIQGRVICKNSELVPDSNAGLVQATNAVTNNDPVTDPTTGGSGRP